MSYKKLIAQFSDALRNPAIDETHPFIAVIAGDPKFTALARLNVYRNSSRESVICNLKEVYPVIQKLVGDEFFRQMAQEFIQKNPSRQPNLADSCSGFSEFIAAYPPARSLPYLADVARLEFYWLQSFCGPEARALDTRHLAQLDADQQAAINFKLVGNGHLLASNYAVFAIWQMNQDDYRGPELRTKGLAVVARE